MSSTTSLDAQSMDEEFQEMTPGEAFDYIMARIETGFRFPIAPLARMISRGAEGFHGDKGSVKRLTAAEKWLEKRGYKSTMLKGKMYYEKRSAAKCS